MTVIPLFPDPLLPGAAADLVLDGQLALPLPWEVGPGVPAEPPTPRHLRIVPEPGQQIPGEPSPHVPDPLPPAWVARMARAIAEVGAGDRPANQLTRWVERAELNRLAARGQAAARHPATRGRRGALAAQRAAQQVRAVRVCPIRPGVAETSAVLVGGGRGRAVALRFEFTADRWLVTAISLG